MTDQTSNSPFRMAFDAKEKASSSRLNLQAVRTVELSWTAVPGLAVRIFKKRGEPDSESRFGCAMDQSRFESSQAPLLGSEVDIDTHSLRHSGGTARLVYTETTDFDLRPILRPDLPRTVTFTAVVSDGELSRILPPRVIAFVGDSVVIDLIDRGKFNLLRFGWPVGASKVEAWITVLESGEMSRNLLSSIDYNAYERWGGIPLRLGSRESEIYIEGSFVRTGEKFVGRSSSIKFPGRSLVHFHVEVTARRFRGRTARLLARVEPYNYASIDFELVRITRNMFYGQKVGVLNGTIPGYRFGDSTEVERCLTEFPTMPGESYELRLPNSTTYVARLLPSTPESLAPLRPRKPVSRCQRCLFEVSPNSREFRCAGECEVTPDHKAWKSRHPASTAPPTKDMPSFSAGSATRLDLVSGRAESRCPGCEHWSQRELCGNCHAALAQGYNLVDTLGVFVVGIRGSGKTKFIGMTLKHLAREICEPAGSHISYVDNECPESRSLLRYESVLGASMWDRSSTRPVSQGNSELLWPILADLPFLSNSATGKRARLAVFDTSGEELESQREASPYWLAMRKADFIFLLVDPSQIEGMKAVIGVNRTDHSGSMSAGALVDNLKDGILGDASKIRLAVVVTKFDLIEQAAVDASPGTEIGLDPSSPVWLERYIGMDPDFGRRNSSIDDVNKVLFDSGDSDRVSDNVRSILLKWGGDSLVDKVESIFRDVRYFGVSALGSDYPSDSPYFGLAGAAPHRIGDPLRWAMWVKGWEKSK